MLRVTLFADRALEALRQWPALTECRADCGTGTGLAVKSLQIVHLHRPDEADLYLTWPVIMRLSAALADSGQIRFVPGDDWLRVRLQTDGDVTMLMSLVSVAIQANAVGTQRADYRQHVPCSQMLAARLEVAPAPPASPARHAPAG